MDFKAKIMFYNLININKIIMIFIRINYYMTLPKNYYGKIFFRNVGVIKESIKRNKIKRLCRFLLRNLYNKNYLHKKIIFIIYFNREDNVSNIQKILKKINKQKNKND